ncbi:MAG: aldo/keto reductase [Phycisphaeraceae bacterium]
MQYRELGETGLRVSALSFGASSLGSVFRTTDDEQSIRAARLALELGVNFIDVSPFYGQTKAESVLGRALRGVPRDSYSLATKVGRYGMDTFDFSAGRVTASVEESLQRLGVDHVDLIQCHDIEFADLDQIVEETLPALARVKQAGKARFVGITGLPLKVFTTVLDRVPAGQVDTILSYCHYSLNDTTLADLLPYLREKGVGVINASPTGMRLLTDGELPDWHPAPEDVQRCCRAAVEHCLARGVDPAKLALQYSVAHPGITTTLVSTANPENMRKNVQWIDEPMDEQLVEEVQQILAPVRDTSWPSGRPENN